MHNSYPEEERQRLLALSGTVKNKRSASAIGKLHKIPEVAIEILEDRDDTVGRFLGFPCEFNASLHQIVVVAPKVVRAQEEKDPPARLVADIAFLMGRRSACEKQGSIAVADRFDDDPALVLLRLVGVLDQSEIQLVYIEINRLVIVPDNNCD